MDLEHADRVKKQATLFLQQIHQNLGIKKHSELFDLLKWGALLHEVGLSISLQAFHRHSAYILRHTYMPGFNREQQSVLATLVRFQRKALKLHEMEELTLFNKKHVVSLIRICGSPSYSMDNAVTTPFLYWNCLPMARLGP